MTLLPIVERELRVAARRKTTGWIRFLAALTTIGVGWVLLIANQPKLTPADIGQQIFLATSVLMFAFSLCAGIFLTADCLCSERHDGTLGLLFLTDLRGYDVVLGKLAATSLVAAYSLFAVVPVLGLTMLVGGIDVVEFSRMVLVVGVTLLLSLATGMFMSALCQETKSAMLATLGVLTGLTGGLFLLGWGLRLVAPRVSPDFLVWPNPIATFVLALAKNYSGGGATDFWLSVVCLLSMASCQFALASWLLPRSWQQGKTDSAPGNPATAGGGSRRSPRAFGITEPYFWLASRDRYPGLVAWLGFGALVLAWSGVCLAIVLGKRPLAKECLVASVGMAFGLHVVVKVMLALQATRRFAEDTRSGALELLLGTPLPAAEIVEGHWRAQVRQFAPLLWTLTFVNFSLIVAVFSQRVKLGVTPEAVVTLVTLLLGGVLLLVSDFHVINWVGMRQAVRGQRHHRAAMTTLLRVLPGPWLGVFFFVFIILGTRGSPYTVVFLFYLFYAVAGVIYAQVQAHRAKQELSAALRLIAAGEKVLPPPPPPASS